MKKNKVLQVNQNPISTKHMFAMMYFYLQYTGLVLVSALIKQTYRDLIRDLQNRYIPVAVLKGYCSIKPTAF